MPTREIRDSLVSTGPWLGDPSVLTAMRVRKTRQAYQDHDLLTALLEAEEILDTEPDNVEALELLANTELELGHAREALLAYEKLHALEPANLEYLQGLAAARFFMVDFSGCLEAAEESLDLEPDLAEAHANAGLALERLFRFEEAERHLRRAAELEPESYPLPPPLETIDWNRLLREALELLPPSLSSFYRRVPLVWHLFPDPTILFSVDPPISPMVLALYEGSPPPDEHATEVLPRSVRLYQGVARRLVHDMETLVQDLAQALLAEASDWMGVPFPPDET